MINSNKKEEYLQRWEPILTKLGVNSEFHIKLALYAEQHREKNSSNLETDPKSYQANSLSYALAVLSKIKDLNKVMIVNSLEGSVGIHAQKILKENDINADKFDDHFMIYDLVNTFNSFIDDDKIICVQFLFNTIQIISEPSYKTQVTCLHNYMIC